MPDLWEDGETETSDFELPGDAQILAETSVAQEEEPEAPAEEPEAPAEDQGEEETPSPAEPPPEPEAEDYESFLSKYGGDEKKAFAAFKEAQSKIGEQARELGDLREQQRQYAEYLQAVEQQKRYQSQGQPDWDEAIAENPAEAAKYAALQGNGPAYYAAMEAWEEISPGTPQVWYEGELMKANLAQQNQVEREREIGNRIGELTEQYPDLAESLPEMMEVAPRYPYELRTLLNGSPQEVAAAAESLYLKARGLKGDTLVRSAEDLARKQTEAEMRVREEASVASASRTHTEPAPSVAEQIAAEWNSSTKKLDEGWNIGGPY